MSSKPASPLDAASDRLAKAFSKLEKAVAARPAPSGDAAEALANWEAHCATLESDLASANDEADRLKKELASTSSQLQSLQKEYVALKKIAGKVADTLDEKAAQLDLIG